MNFEIGKLINYDGYTGDIVSKDKKYVFLSKNTEDRNLTNNQAVVFEPAIVNNINIAFNVISYDLYINKKTNPRLVKKNNNNYDIID